MVDVIRSSTTSIVINNETTPISSSTFRLPTVLTVAGSDPSGGAGIEADIKTITALNCNAQSCIDCLTIQNTLGVKGKYASSLETVSTILNSLKASSVLSGNGIQVIKCGMITNEVLTCLPIFIKELSEYQKKGPYLVIDPIISSTSGFTLSKQILIRNSLEQLYPMATLITPNFEEAMIILKILDLNHNITQTDCTSVPASIEYMKEVAQKLTGLLRCRAILLKGGHMPNITPTTGNHQVSIIMDILYDSKDNSYTIYKHPKFSGLKNTHGTGCTLSSAIACGLASGLSLREAVERGVEYVHNALCFADTGLGEGTGPLNHVFCLR